MTIWFAAREGARAALIDPRTRVPGFLTTLGIVIGVRGHRDGGDRPGRAVHGRASNFRDSAATCVIVHAGHGARGRAPGRRRGSTQTTRPDSLPRRGIASITPIMFVPNGQATVARRSPDNDSTVLGRRFLPGRRQYWRAARRRLSRQRQRHAPPVAVIGETGARRSVAARRTRSASSSRSTANGVQGHRPARGEGRDRRPEPGRHRVMIPYNTMPAPQGSAASARSSRSSSRSRPRRSRQRAPDDHAAAAHAHKLKTGPRTTSDPQPDRELQDDLQFDPDDRHDRDGEHR